MNKTIDLSTWNRKEHFQFFSQFDEPFFGIVAEADCTDAYKTCRDSHKPFFLFYLHKAILAVNLTEEFRYRIQGEEVIDFEPIHVTTTIARNDNTFAFAFIPFVESFKDFTEYAEEEIAKVQDSSGLRLSENSSRADVIHFSAVPWLSFTGASHARNFKIKDSVPKITFGKFFQRNKRLIMPVSVNAHHGLMDAFHVAKFLQQFEQLMSEKEDSNLNDNKPFLI
jgi:chloramphenicol O-acetyltransferase type A